MAALLGALIFIVSAWAQGTMSTGSGAGQPVVKKAGPNTTGIFFEAAACARVAAIHAEPADFAPEGRRMFVGPGSPPASAQGSSSLALPYDSNRVFDADAGTFWHIDPSKKLRAEWLMIDLGSKRRAPVSYIRMLPRPELPDQIFTTACLEGGNDGKQWRAIANLSLPESQKTANWFGWDVPPAGSYRYFKILIPRVMFEQSQNQKFYSIGKLEMYQ